MSVPVQIQILDRIGERLKSISSNNGYFSTVEKIERARTTPFKNGDIPFLNYYPVNDEENKPLNTAEVERILTVVVEYYDLTRDRIFTDVAAELAMDVRIALERDVSAPLVTDNPSTRLGKLVSGVKFDTSFPAIGEGQKPYAGSILTIDITYKVSRHDLFTLIT